MVQRELDAGFQLRHTKRQQKRIRAMKIRRTVFFSTLFLILLCVILFCTPIFKIRTISFEGNVRLSTEELSQVTAETEGNNLFRTKLSKLKKEFLKIPYVQDVSIERIYLHPGLKITVTEGEPVAGIACTDGFALIDEAGKVLEVTAEQPQEIPVVTGIAVAGVTAGTPVLSEPSEQLNAAIECLRQMKKIDILSGVRELSVADLGNITFNYEDRLDAVCGSAVDLEKKMGVFKSSVNSNRLNKNSRGTLDLSTTGKAIYRPSKSENLGITS